MVADWRKKRCIRRIVRSHNTRFDPTKHELRYRGSKWKVEKAKGGFCHSLYVSGDGLALRLKLSPTRQPLTMGLLPLGLLGSVNYYAVPNLICSGEVQFGSESVSIKGRAWIDRMWGTWEPAGFARWEWISMMMNDGTSAVVFAVYHPVRARVLLSAVLVSQQKNSRQVNHHGIRITRLKEWKSKQTQVAYPVSWRITSEDPATDLIVVPKFDSQEFRSYLWEGVCSFSGRLDGRRVQGDAYGEVLYGLAQTEMTLTGLMLLYYETIRYGVRKISRQAADQLDTISARFGGKLLSPYWGDTNST